MTSRYGDSLPAKEASARKIDFTVIGEGDTVRILPLDSEMISIMRRTSLGSTSLCSPLSIGDDTSLAGWTCALCAYENVDFNSTTCSICGSTRGAGEDEPSPSPSESSVPRETVPEQVTEDANRHASFASQLTVDSKLNVELDPLPEDKELEKIQSDTNKKECSPRRISIDFEEMMSMSFASWSVSDDGPWTCASCTYLNQDPLHLTCEVCGHGRSKLKNSSSHQSLSEFFNSSVLGGKSTLVENRTKIIIDLEDKAVKRERMDELVAEQFKILSELQEGHQVSKTEKRKGCLKETKHLLEELQGKLSHMQELLEQERKEQKLAEEAQRRKHSVIERQEGLPPLEDCRNDALSTETMMLLAQQRMLNDWKNNSDARQQQLEYARQQQASLLEKYRYFYR